MMILNLLKTFTSNIIIFPTENLWNEMPFTILSIPCILQRIVSVAIDRNPNTSGKNIRHLLDDWKHQVADLGLGHTWASGSMVFAATPQHLELTDVNRSNEVSWSRQQDYQVAKPCLPCNPTVCFFCWDKTCLINQAPQIAIVWTHGINIHCLITL